MARTASAAPAEVLRRNLERAKEFGGRAGDTRVTLLLERAQRDLDRRLREAEGLGGPGADSFTAEQLRVTLAQVRSILAGFAGDLRDEIVDRGRRAAGQAAGGVVRYLDGAERRFSGINQGLQIREAAVFDRAVSGASASILRRLGSDPRDPASPGILARYGMQVVGKFEETLQQRFLARKPWAEVRADLISKSPFLKDAPLYWAERIVRTEVMGAHGVSSWEAIRAVDDQVGGMLKVLCASFDDRTSADSYAYHGQIRRPDEPFEKWGGGLYMHPPNRPNDRETVVPHRVTWPLPKALEPKSDAEVAARWAKEGRKGSPPPRPLMSTVDLAEARRARSERQQQQPAPEPRRSAPPPRAPTPVPPPPPAPVPAPPPPPPPPPAPAGVQIDQYVGDYADHMKDRRMMMSAYFDGRSVDRADEARVYSDAVADIFRGFAPTLESLERTWSAQASGFTINMHRTLVQSELKANGRKNEVTFSGTVKHQGRDVGTIERSFIRHGDGTLEVHHDLFKIHDKTLQGQGLGETMLRQSIQSYEKLGVNGITVDTAWVGKYTWASFGYNWDADTAKRKQPKLAAFLKKHGVAAKRAEDIAARAVKNSWDVAALDVDGIRVKVKAFDPNTNALSGPEREEKIGKAFLLSDDSGWSGTIKLDPNDPSYKRAKERLKL